MENNYTLSRFDELTSDLCYEIDQLRRDRDYWKQKFEEERAAYSQSLTDQMETAKKGVANALIFALSVTANADGSLSISKEDRKQLAENFK